MPETGEEGRLLARILAHGLERPGAEALRCEGASLSWQALREAVLEAAGFLAPVIMDGSGRIALLGGASVELVVAYLAIAAAGGAIGQGRAIGSAAEAIARNPGAVGDIRGVLILGLVLIESLVIYVLLVTLILFFIKPFGG